MTQYVKSIFDLGDGPGRAVDDPRARELQAWQQLRQQATQSRAANALGQQQLAQQGAMHADRMALERQRMIEQQDMALRAMKAGKDTELADRAFREAMTRLGMDYQSQQQQAAQQFQAAEAEKARAMEQEKSAKYYDLQREQMAGADSRFQQQLGLQRQGQAAQQERFQQEMGLKQGAMDQQKAMMETQQRMAAAGAAQQVFQELGGAEAAWDDPERTTQMVEMLRQFQPEVAKVLIQMLQSEMMQKKFEETNPEATVLSRASSFPRWWASKLDPFDIIESPEQQYARYQELRNRAFGGGQ